MPHLFKQIYNMNLATTNGTFVARGLLLTNLRFVDPLAIEFKFNISVMFNISPIGC